MYPYFKTFGIIKTVGRPKKSDDEKLVPASLTIHPSIDVELDEILESDMRPKGLLIRQIFMRGWAAYKRDGLLVEPAVNVKTARLPVVKVNQNDAERERKERGDDSIRAPAGGRSVRGGSRR
jgi:hypothetical protein